jgi:hypothetical protein
MLTFSRRVDIMPYTAISTLPVSPSRLGDPTNFISESLAFLDAQINFTSNCNTVASYFNAAKFDPYNWGNLSAISGSSPVYISSFIAAPPTVPPMLGTELADSIDGLLSSMVAFVPDANTVGTWIDTLINPSAPLIVDPTRPTISTVNATPLRNDGQLTFETKAISFYGSARSFSLSLQQFADYVATFSSGLEDWNSIVVTYTDNDDWGLINE